MVATIDERVRSGLQRQLAELSSRLGKIKKDATQTHSSDSAEQAQERENDEVIDTLGTETATSIAQIKAALRRVETGSYGSCTHCGEIIDKARLAIIPETPSCVKCAAAG